MGASPVRVIKNQLEPLSGRQALTIDNTAGGVSLTVPSGAIYAACRLETGQIRFTLDGTTPDTSTAGTLLEIGEMLALESRAELTAFKAIRQSSTSGVLQVEYFGVDMG